MIRKYESHVIMHLELFICSIHQLRHPSRRVLFFGCAITKTVSLESDEACVPFRLLIPVFRIRCLQIAETPEMESPSARDALVEAQEDSTSVEDSASSSDVATTSSTTGATMTTATTTVPSSADVTAARLAESEDLVCERLDERTDEEIVVERQSSDYSCLQVDLKISKEDAVRDGGLNDVSPEVSSSDGRVIEDQPSKVSPGRKRPAGSDFLPIGAEMKKIGVEISEEEAIQLRNDVRRLSPVLVSLRERTLGEVSFTSESCLFGDETRSNALPSDDPRSGGLARRDEEISPSTAECTEKADERTVGEKKVSPRCDGSSTASAENSAEVSQPSIYRQFFVVLNHIDQTNVCSHVTRNDSLQPVEQDKIGEEKQEEKGKKCSSKSKKNPKKSWQSDSSSTKSRTCKPTKSEPHYPVMKTCAVVLERISESKRLEDATTKEQPIGGKLADNEEVASGGEDSRVSQHELDSSETVPSSPEEPAEETSADVAEGADTETETETGSDSSEVSAMTTNIRLRDVPSDQLPCAEVSPLCCVEMAPIMTRLETERPEPYTEDSAESLALATGARDEVRSDGSDSGLGSEIPGDPGPAPAPESDSETSFLDRIPDDILSDKEKGNDHGSCCEREICADDSA